MWWRVALAFLILGCFAYIMFALQSEDKTGYNKWRYHGPGDVRRER